MDVPTKRRRRALLGLGAVLAVLGLAGVAAPSAEPAGAGVGFSGRAYAERLIAESGRAAQGLPSAEGLESPATAFAGTVRSAGAAPSWVSEEIASLDVVQEVRATDDWSVMGFTLETDAAGAQAWMTAQLEERGWVLIDTGVEGSATAVKEGGRRPWLLFSCTTVGDAACIVVQVPAP